MPAATSEMGVTDTRLFTIGMPNSASISSPVRTSRPARRQILSYTFVQLRVDVRVRAVEQGDAHGNGADVEMLLVDHGDRLQNFTAVDHGCVLSDAVHGVEDVLALGADLQAALRAGLVERAGEVCKRDGALRLRPRA